MLYAWSRKMLSLPYALNVIISHSVHSMRGDTDAAELHSEQLDVLS